MNRKEIDRRFGSNLVDEDQDQRQNHIMNEFRLLAIEVNESCHDCRQKSLAMTRLEEGLMWALEAIVHGG